ncbi:FAD-binding domain-containing protein [Aspergillus pseudonomiae]|uniref:ferric-chelate reductase (NADPH) n=1 Tax=Aspergillus pseudonomiae TaxID=1506151 RepID=A0A5N7DLF5_9EURO|nr:FAD-binding domain-containing protein [Aspergillus pseudonomiae]KAE8407135.1 FAD-binding domain-containing protein [Aspergillus pseudonomiae]
MEPEQLYAACLGGTLLLLLVFRFAPTSYRPVPTSDRRWRYWIARLFRFTYRKLCFLFLKHVLYPRLFGHISRYRFILQSIYWAGTITCNFVGTHTLSSMAARAGNIAVLNFISLLLAGRIYIAADLLGLSYRSYLHVHRTFAMMTFVQTTLHTVMSIREHGWLPYEQLQFYGILGIAACAASFIIVVFRKWVYEVFIKMHYWLGILALGTIWRHIYIQRVFAQLYVLVGSIIFALTTLLHWVLLVLRNVTCHKCGSRASVIRGADLQTAQIDIPVNRPFTVRAGMTVYIWMPGVSLLSALYCHPFTIAWWENNDTGKATKITLLVNRRSGFTRNLIEHRAKEFITWIDGPYGNFFDLRPYQRILMLASGVGITAQISYIRELLEANAHPTRSIFVVWEVEEEGNLRSVHHWMNELLTQDKHSYILRFGLYIPRNPKSHGAPEPWNSLHDRIWKMQGPIDTWKAVTQEFWKGPGNALVTVSAYGAIRREIRKVIQANMEDIVDLVELPFQPEINRPVFTPGKRRGVVEEV